MFSFCITSAKLNAKCAKRWMSLWPEEEPVVKEPFELCAWSIRLMMLILFLFFLNWIACANDYKYLFMVHPWNDEEWAIKMRWMCIAIAIGCRSVCGSGWAQACMLGAHVLSIGHRIASKHFYKCSIVVAALRPIIRARETFTSIKREMHNNKLLFVSAPLLYENRQHWLIHKNVVRRSRFIE